MKDYHDTREKRVAADKVRNPLEAREKKLAEQIRDGLNELEQTSAKRGEFRATLESVAGRVAWKEAFSDLRTKAEAAGLKVVEPTADDAVRLSVVPVS